MVDTLKTDRSQQSIDGWAAASRVEPGIDRDFLLCNRDVANEGYGGEFRDCTYNYPGPYYYYYYYSYQQSPNSCSGYNFVQQGEEQFYCGAPGGSMSFPYPNEELYNYYYYTTPASTSLGNVTTPSVSYDNLH